MVNNLGAAVAAATPGRIALIDLGGGAPRHYSYADINEHADAAAHHLSQFGLDRGDRVAILSANRAEFLLAFLGAMRAGFVAVPVNHRLPATTIAAVIADSDARLVLADAERSNFVPAGLPMISLENLFGSGTFGPFPAIAPAPGEAAMFLYTSGSTGKPKGVVLSHQSHLWVLNTRSRALGLAEQRSLVAAPLYHMNGLAMSQLSLAAGGSLVLLPAFTARSYIEAAATWRATALTAVPPMIAMMLREPDLLAAADLSCVKSIRMGSAPVTQGLMDRIAKVFPSAAVTIGYGTTEAGPVVFAQHPTGKPTPNGSLGCAHPEVSLRLVRDGAVVADEGVLEMRCPALMNGYHNLPEATAKVMTTDGHYITGDIFFRDADGFYAFVGRADDMFVSGGENIFPGAIETVLESHPAIMQAAVIDVPDEIKGTKPVAFVVLRPGTALTENDARTHVLAHAPAYAHPRRVFFLSHLPLAGTNKIDRRALREVARQEMQP
jgi:acyl-CoA synthetase (AMP-forming)/AMP-acid ligase II